jgi:hypothetical protein
MKVLEFVQSKKHSDKDKTWLEVIIRRRISPEILLEYIRGLQGWFESKIISPNDSQNNSSVNIDYIELKTKIVILPVKISLADDHKVNLIDQTTKELDDEYQ